MKNGDTYRFSRSGTCPRVRAESGDMYFRYVSPFFLGVVHHHARVASRQALGPDQGTCTSGTCPPSLIILPRRADYKEWGHVPLLPKRYMSPSPGRIRGHVLPVRVPFLSRGGSPSCPGGVKAGPGSGSGDMYFRYVSPFFLRIPRQTKYDILRLPPGN